jgi:hypothetical protein
MESCQAGAKFPTVVKADKKANEPFQEKLQKYWRTVASLLRVCGLMLLSRAVRYIDSSY